MVNLRRLPFLYAAIYLAIFTAAAPLPHNDTEVRALKPLKKPPPTLPKATPSKPSTVPTQTAVTALTSPTIVATSSVKSGVTTSSSLSKSTSLSSSATTSSSASQTSNSAISCPLPSKSKGGAKGAKGGKVKRVEPLQTKDTLALGSITRGITRASTQGENSDVFTVDAPGWPDASGVDTPAFAKTVGKNDPGDAQREFPKEIQDTATVGQSLATGTDCNNRKWLVTRKAPGNPFKQTPAFATAGAAGCQEALTQAITTTVNAIQDAVEKHGLRHNDPNPGNVFFSDDLSSATLIDWAGAKDVPDKVYTDAAKAQDSQTVKLQFQGQCNAPAGPPPPGRPGPPPPKGPPRGPPKSKRPPPPT